MTALLVTTVFVASGVSATVRFENDSPDGDNTFFIDGVSVVPSGGSASGALSCQFEVGDGIGGSESQVGVVSQAILPLLAIDRYFLTDCL